MAFKTKEALQKLLQEFDYVPTATAKERKRWQLLKWSGRLIGIGGPVVIKKLPPKQNIQVPEAEAIEYAYLYENTINPQTGINAAYGHLIEKRAKASAAAGKDKEGKPPADGKADK
jgi:hypothetical protein